MPTPRRMRSRRRSGSCSSHYPLFSAFAGFCPAPPAGRALRNFETQWAPLLEPLLPPADEASGATSDARRLHASVTAALAAINPRYSRALTLRFLEDRTRADCAALMDVKLGTFDVLLLRAVRAFRAQWQEQARSDDGEPRAQVFA
jgi:DNA-directed RNA polymerase specialized sigma24 family protein